MRSQILGSWFEVMSARHQVRLKRLSVFACLCDWASAMPSNHLIDIVHLDVYDFRLQSSICAKVMSATGGCGGAFADQTAH